MENQRPCSSNLLQSHVCIDHLLGRPGTSGHKVAEGTFSCVKAWAAVATLKPDLGMPIWDALVLPMTNIAKKVSLSFRPKQAASIRGPHRQVCNEATLDEVCVIGLTAFKRNLASETWTQASRFCSAKRPWLNRPGHVGGYPRRIFDILKHTWMTSLVAI